LKVRYHQVESWLIEVVRRRLGAFDYHGKLDRQHFSFFKTAVIAPFPVYHHLVFCYNRSDRKLQLKVGCSLFSEWQLKRSLGRVSFLSEMIACDIKGHAKFMKSRLFFEKKLLSLLDDFLPEHTQRLVEDPTIRKALSVLAQKGTLSRQEFSSKLISDLRLVKKLEYGSSPRTLGATAAETTMPNEAVAAFLADLVPEEAEISAGEFSLNAEHAGRKLQRFQLSSPQNFVVHVIGGAIAGGASEVQIHIDSDDIVVDFDGRPLERAELASLRDSLLYAGSSQRSREFAVALNAAKSMEPLSLRLETWHKGSGFALDFESSEEPRVIETSPFEDPSREGHRFHFRDKPSLRVVQRFLNSLRFEHPELDLIRRRCGLGPIPLVMEQTDVRDFPFADSACYLAWNDEANPLGLPDTSHLEGKSERSPSDFSALFLVGPPRGLHVLVNGVLYDPPSDTKSFPVWCLLVDNRLKRDLSFTGVRNDDRWNEILLKVYNGVERVTGLVISQYVVCKDEEKKILASFLRQCAAAGAEAPLQHRIFGTLDNRFFSIEQLRQRQRLLYTEREWKYPLRNGQPVLTLSETERKLASRKIDKTPPVFECIDEELESNQIYFRRREQWLQQPVRERLEWSRPYGPVRNLKDGSGQLGLAKHLGPCRLDLFALHRPLPTMLDHQLPKGLRIMVNDDGLETDDHWSTVLPNLAFQELLKELTPEIDQFYNSLWDFGCKYTDHLLAYLFHRKQKRQKWHHFVPRLEFRVLDGSSRKWADLNQTDGLAGASAAWLRTFHIAPQQLRMMGELLR
jgi:hypothetical protein